ncbi:MAG: hypothetical protein LIP01_01615 [Tannerellaceae bacterium]|nr:hypothetical protein [Tannerellaceae bacterium]
METGRRSLSLQSKGITQLSIPWLINMQFEDIRNQLQNNIEAMIYHGRWLFQSELMTMCINQKDPDKHFFGWGGYLQGGYLLRGKRYGYDEIDALPVMPVEPHTLILVARFNITDLNDTKPNYHAGCQKDFSLAVNYYFNNYISTRLNYNFIHTDRYSALGKNNIQMMQLRLQVRF